MHPNHKIKAYDVYFGEKNKEYCTETQIEYVTHLLTSKARRKWISQKSLAMFHPGPH